MIEHPLIHSAFSGLVAWLIGHALLTGEVKLNSGTYQRRLHPIRYWFEIAVGCFLLLALAGPLVERYF